jgi:hypothetical protein
MGRLRCVEDGTCVDLPAMCVVGRQAGCDLVPTGDLSRVSRMHAVLRWTSDRWTARDAGSRNGTSWNGRLLSPERPQALQIGDRLRFGDEGWTWELIDEAPPEASAHACGQRLLALGGVLNLSDTPGAEVVVRRDPTGAWVCDDAGGVRPVADGDELTVGDVRWRLSLPEVAAGTRAGASSAEAWQVELTTDADALRVAARLVHAGVVHDLGVRAHHRLLHTLARERTRALRRGQPDGGWVSPEDLAQHLDQTTNALHVQLHRLRAQLHTIEGADAVLERRFAGELRLGPSQISLREEG